MESTIISAGHTFALAYRIPQAFHEMLSVLEATPLFVHVGIAVEQVSAWDRSLFWVAVASLEQFLGHCYHICIYIFV